MFFIRDALKFSDFIHSQKRDPRTGVRDNTMHWDFWSLSPESMHQITTLFSDRGIPATLLHMHGFGSHTISLWNEVGERYRVKRHFKTMQGIKNLRADEATKIAGEDLDFHRRDLFNAIEKGDLPNWKVMVPIMPEKDAETYSIHPFDVTNIWPHKGYPLVEVGVLELNRNPQNSFC